MQKLPFTKNFNQLFIAYCVMVVLTAILGILAWIFIDLAVKELGFKNNNTTIAVANDDITDEDYNITKNSTHYSITQNPPPSFVEIIRALAPGLILALSALVPLIISAVFWLIMLYRFWELVPKQNRQYELGYLIGFSLIPLFVYYWNFVAVWGCGKEFNRLFNGTKKTLDTFSLIYCIAVCASFISSLFGLISFVFGMIWLYQMKNAAIILQQERLAESVNATANEEVVCPCEQG